MASFECGTTFKFVLMPFLLGILLKEMLTR